MSSNPPLPPPEEPMSYSAWVKQWDDYHRAVRRRQARNANGKHLGRRRRRPKMRGRGYTATRRAGKASRRR